jgi:acyl carrier protein
MQEEEIALRDSLSDLIAKEALIEKVKITPNATIESLGIDSLDYSMILMAVEEKYNVYISVDAALSTLNTFSDLIEYLLERIEQNDMKNSTKLG